MPQPFLFELVFILGSAAGGGLAASAGLETVLAWILAVLTYLGYHLYRLLRLIFLIRRRHRLAPPFPLGLWGDIYRTIAQYQQRGRRGHKRQIRFIRRFREAAVSVPDALVVLDKQQRVEWANPAAAILMDISWPKDAGRRLTEILASPELRERIEAGEYGTPIELTPTHNRAIVLSLRLTPFGERKRQRLVVARDVTTVYHLNMIRRDFFANASHELRTPLTVIAGFLENLVDSPATPQRHRRPLELMGNQTARMRSIVDDLLTLSRLEMDDRSEEVTTADVPAELNLVLHEAKVLSGGRHSFDANIDHGLLITGNQAELRSGFANLIHNAVTHTPAGSRIRVVWKEDERAPLFSVQDDGEGIAPEHIPRLTERFYRVDKARSRDAGGTGLGLAIVQHVLNRHDAQLAITSEIGQGTTFSCRFPHTSIVRRQQARIGGIEVAAG